MSDDFVTLNEARYLLERARINKLYRGLDAWEIRELVRQYCEALVGSMSIPDIIQMGGEGTYDHMFHIDLDNLKDKKYEEDVVLDFKHDHEISDESN